jgi:hypothetical protein
MGERRGMYRILRGEPWGERPLGKLGADWRIILRCFFKKRDGGHGLD